MVNRFVDESVFEDAHSNNTVIESSFRCSGSRTDRFNRQVTRLSDNHRSMRKLAFRCEVSPLLGSIRDLGVLRRPCVDQVPSSKRRPVVLESRPVVADDTRPLRRSHQKVDAEADDRRSTGGAQVVGGQGGFLSFRMLLRRRRRCRRCRRGESRRQ